MTVTKKDVSDSVSSLRAQVLDWKNQPDKINAAFDDLKWKSLAIWSATTDERDAAQQHLKDLIVKLDQIMDGIEAPYLFIEYAAEWQSVAAKIRTGKNQVSSNPRFILEGHWTGDAKERYSASRGLQDQAMATCNDLAEKVHDQLLKLSESGRNLYKAVVDALGVFLAAVGAALTQIVAIITSIEGAGKLVDAVFAALGSANAIYTQYVNEINSHTIVANELINLIDNPTGLPGNKWPESVSKTFEDPKLWKQTE